MTPEEIPGRPALDVLIIGGGITGLAAAWRLQKQKQAGLSLRYYVIESQAKIGGKIATRRDGSFLIEEGPDSFLASKPAMTELIQELELHNELIPVQSPDRSVFIWSRKRLWPLKPEWMLAAAGPPLTYLGCRLLSWPARLRACLEPLAVKGTGQDETLLSFISRRFGVQVFDRIFEPLASGIWAGDAAVLSVQSTFKRLLELEQSHGSVLKGLSPHANSPSSPGPFTFMSFKSGMQALINALRHRIPEECILTNRRVSLYVGRLGLDHVVQTQNTQVWRARAMILACPSYEASMLLMPVNPTLGKLLAEIPYTSTASVSLAYRREAFEQEPRGLGFLVPKSEKKALIGASFSSNKFEGRSGANHALIRAFLRERKAGEIAGISETELIKLAHAELAPILRIKEEPVTACVSRWIRANPQYLVGHAGRVKQMRDMLVKIPGIWLAGSPYDGVGLGDCVESGIRAADEALRYIRF